MSHLIVFHIFFIVVRICSGILLTVAVYIVSGVGSMLFKVIGQWEIRAWDCNVSHKN